MLSSIHDSSVGRIQLRSKDTDTGFRTQLKPNLAVLYNKHMGGVDSVDQLSTYYNFPHKSMKWYHVIYHFSKEVALVNAYISYVVFTGNKKMSQIQFRREIIDGLLEGCEMPGPIRKASHKPKTSEQIDRETFP